MLERIGWVIFISFAARFELHEGPEQRMCQNRSMSGTAKGIMIRTLSEVAARLQTDCDDDPRRIIDKCRNVDFSSDERCPVLSVLEELCASSRFEGRTCEAADDPVRILGKVESQDPEFQKNI